MIIQDPKTKEFKKHKPHELPDGCVVSGNKLDDVHYGFVKEKTMYCKSTLGFGVPLEILCPIKIHDIVNDKGKRTYHLRYMATSKTGRTFIWAYKPERMGVSWYHPDPIIRKLDSNSCGQTWEDEPWEVWECIE